MHAWVFSNLRSKAVRFVVKKDMHIAVQHVAVDRADFNNSLE